jgi:hypothetical protein
MTDEKTFIIHASESVTYRMKVKAKTLYEAMQAVIDDPGSYIPDEGGEPIDGTFVINKELTEEE